MKVKRQSSKDTRGMGNEKERISGSIGWRSDEPV